MKTLLFLLLSLLPLAAQQHIQVRVVSIEKPGVATSLEAAQPDCDETLYASLIADIANGKAKLVHDQTVVVRGANRAKTESIREFPFLNGFGSNALSWVLYPSDFACHHLGHVLEVEATVIGQPESQIGRMLDINLAPEQSSLLAMHPRPVPDFRGTGQMGHLRQPVIARHKLTAQVWTWTGRTVLLSVAASPGAALQESTEIPFRYTFLRAGLDREKPAPVNARPEKDPGLQVRLHAVTFRLPRDEAAALMLQHAGDDAALYSQLSAAAKSGTAALNAHTSILVRNGHRSTVDSRTWFPLPKSVGDEFGRESQNASRPGEALAVEYSEPHCNFGLESQEAPEIVPFHPSAAHPSLHEAETEYVERKRVQHGTIPESGVLCTSVLSTSPATDEAEAPGGLTDVTFLLRSPRSGPSVVELKPNPLLHAAFISVPAAEGRSLAEVTSYPESPAPASALLERLYAGELHCAAHAAATIHSVHCSKVECVRNVQQPVKFKPAAATPEVSLPEEWNLQRCGLSLEADVAGAGKDHVFNLKLEWDTAPVLPFGAPGAAIPEISERRCVQKIHLKDLRLTPGQPFIADVRASNARPGTPEHGRWHVLVLLAK